MSSPLKVGITGGIGSGKTIITKAFAALGIPVYYSDEESKKLLDTDEAIVSAIKKHFGGDSYHNGKIDRAKLAGIVFNNKEKLELLNSITHPAVRLHFLNWVKEQQAPYILKEAAIMYESGANRDIDQMITVFAPKEVRIQRAMARENTTREQIEARMSKQMSEEEKMKLAHFTIFNDGEKPVLPQVLHLHELFLQKAVQQR